MYGYGMPMGGMGMPMGGIGMPMNNMNMMGNMGLTGGGEDDEWMKGFKMGVEEVNNPGGDNDPDLNKPGPKLNVLFTTTIGTSRNIILNHSTTIDEALKKYLKLVGRPDLIGKEQDIGFLFNANKVSFGNNTPVEVFFRNVAVPKIVVNDTKGLIGALN